MYSGFRFGCPITWRVHRHVFPEWFSASASMVILTNCGVLQLALRNDEIKNPSWLGRASVCFSDQALIDPPTKNYTVLCQQFYYTELIQHI